jgi:frataxin-like iron-binding protein CyaY
MFERKHLNPLDDLLWPDSVVDHLTVDFEAQVMIFHDQEPLSQQWASIHFNGVKNLNEMNGGVLFSQIDRVRHTFQNESWTSCFMDDQRQAIFSII